MLAKRQSQALLEGEIDRVIRALSAHDPSSTDYQTLIDRLILLNRIREEDKSRFGSKDNLAVVFGNLMGILMIVKHEHVNVITSKAMSLVLRPITRT